MEEWRPVRTHPNYEVSNFGNVRNVKRKLLHKLQNVRGYRKIDLWLNRRRTMWRVHRLVVETFVGPIPPGKVVDHINRDRSDNRLSNLRVVSPHANGRNRGRRGEAFIGAVIRLHEAGYSAAQIFQELF